MIFIAKCSVLVIDDHRAFDFRIYEFAALRTVGGEARVYPAKQEVAARHVEQPKHDALVAFHVDPSKASKASTTALYSRSILLASSSV